MDLREFDLSRPHHQNSYHLRRLSEVRVLPLADAVTVEPVSTAEFPFSGLRAKFPAHRSREFLRRNRKFERKNREFEPSAVQGWVLDF